MPAKTSNLLASSKSDSRVAIQTPNVLGYTHYVDAKLYAAMRSALLKVLPKKKPGLTQTETRRAVLPLLPKSLFPGGAKADWWSKCVQLDLESKGTIVREKTTPLRWHRKSSE